MGNESNKEQKCSLKVLIKMRRRALTTRKGKLIKYLFLSFSYPTRGMRAIIVLVAGQCPQKIKFYLLSGRGQSQARVVVRQKGLVVVRLLGFLNTAADSRNGRF